MHPLIIDALWYILWLAIGVGVIALLGWLFEGGGFFFGTFIVGVFVFFSMRERPVVAFVAFQVVGAAVACVTAARKPVRDWPKALGSGVLISAGAFAAIYAIGSILDLVFGDGCGTGSCTRSAPQFC